MRTPRERATWLAIVAGALAMAAVAGETTGAQRSALEHKEALVRRLVTDASAAERIEASGNAQAQALLRDARHRHDEALRSIAASELARAERELNEALRLAGRARLLVPDQTRQASELRYQNMVLARTIESLRDSYVSQRARGAGVAAHAFAPDAVVARANERLEQAEALGAASNVQEANTLLRAAERDLMLAMTDALGSNTVHVATRFDRPADEYGYEAARRAAYLELVPIARAQLKPGPEAAAAMERHVATSNGWVDRAQKQAAREEYPAALEAMRHSTAALQNALAAAGLVVPRETASR